MATRHFWLSAAIVIVLVVVVAAIVWPRSTPESEQSSETSTQQDAANAADRSGTPAKRADTGMGELANDRGRTPAQSSQPRNSEPLRPAPTGTWTMDDPYAVFADVAMPMSDRFSKLARLADRGDEDAKYYAMLIARQCHSIRNVPADQPPLGQDVASSHQIELRARMQAECVRVASDPAFAAYAQALEAGAAGDFSARARQTIELFFANKGTESALHVAVSAVAKRPDSATIEMVGDTLARLDISLQGLPQEVIEQAPADPVKRAELMRYALNLLACRHGRPCGPNSFVVYTTCTVLGACLPGADLVGVYESQLLNRQEMAYVWVLLQYLQEFPTNVAWG